MIRPVAWKRRTWSALSRYRQTSRPWSAPRRNHPAAVDGSNRRGTRPMTTRRWSDGCGDWAGEGPHRLAVRQRGDERGPARLVTDPPCGMLAVARMPPS
jgi:hypothetical protein